jgi:peptide/nickel transport system substrate-binding protein
LVAGFLVTSGVFVPPPAGPGAQAAPAAKGQKILTVALEGDVETLDPNFSRFPTANMVNLNVYDQFFQYGWKDTGQGFSRSDVTNIRGAAIESWVMAPDRMSLTMRVRKGVKFSKSGREMTADDIMYWYERGLATKSGVLWNIQTGEIKSFEKKGPYEVLVQFNRPSPLFFFLARDQAWGVQDSVEAKKHATAKDPWATEWLAKNDVGAGEYYVESWQPGVQMVLAANKNYWAGPAYYDKVVLKVIPSSATRALLLRQGSVDMAVGLSPDELDSLRGAPGVKILSVASRTEVIVILNTSKYPFDEKLLRQAVSYLVPYEKIINGIYKGRALPAKSVIPTLGQGFDGRFWKYRHDPGKAKELLDQARYPNGFEFVLNIKQGESIAKLIAVVLQDAFKESGVRVKINEATSAIWSEGMAKGTHQATLWATGFLSYVDDPWYKMRCCISTSVTNRARYKNATIDQIYEKLATASGPERQKLASQFQRIVVEDAISLWLANVPVDYAMRDDVSNFIFQEDALIWFHPLRRR